MDLKTEKLNSLHPSGRPCQPFGCSSVTQHPSGRHGYSIRTPISVQKLRTVQACIRSDVSITRPDAIQCLKSNGFPSQTQIWEDSCNRPDAILDKARRGADLQPSRC
jgi:hypothetical protein